LAPIRYTVSFPIAIRQELWILEVWSYPYSPPHHLFAGPLTFTPSADIIIFGIPVKKLEEVRKKLQDIWGAACSLRPAYDDR